ncbi:MAG: fucose isomerase [Pseudomonadota bacterium]
MSGTRIGIFWPGDYRSKPNDLAHPSAEEATVQLERALKKLGRPSYRIDGFLTRPHEAIEKLGPVDDPLIGVFVHWCYGPHTTDGVVGKESPLLLASNFSGQWPGLVGLLNTGACLESLGRKFSRVWSDAQDWTADDAFMDRLAEWCATGRIGYSTEQIEYSVPISKEAHARSKDVAEEIGKRRILALMLGDTSMGMINGYFGPRKLARIGFSEHKVDQAWIIDRGRSISEDRLNAAMAFVKQSGIQFHWREDGASDFDENATREQLRDYLTVLDLVAEFKADCVGWQYQLGLVPLRPPSDFAEGLLNSVCRPESDGDVIITATEGDQGNLVPMELMKRVLKSKGLHQAVMFHDVRWGAEYQGRFLWVLLNSGSCGGYAMSRDPATLRGVHSYRQPAEYFPIPGGTFAGEAFPGEITWARAYLKDDEMWMDVGRGEVVTLLEQIREQWWRGTTRQWPFMAADLGISQETLMAHYLSNHIAVAYGDILEETAALSLMLGFRVRRLGRSA